MSIIDLRPIFGAIMGDMAGSVFEGVKVVGDDFNSASFGEFAQYFKVLHSPEIQNKVREFNMKNYPLLDIEGQKFTDDTVLTMAI